MTKGVTRRTVVRFGNRGMRKIGSLGNLQSHLGMRFSGEKFTEGLDLLVIGGIQR